MKKSNWQRLKKSKKFAFGNSQFTRQHNISLSGTNKYRRTADKIVYIISHQLGGCRVEGDIGVCGFDPFLPQFFRV